MKVAIPVFNGRVAPTFDWAGRIVLADLNERTVVGQVELDIDGVQAVPRAAFLASTGVDVLICGGVSMPLAAMLDAQGVRVLPGVSGNVTEVLDAFLRGQIEQPRWAMPGWSRCGKRGQHGRGGRGRGHGAGPGGGTT